MIKIEKQQGTIFTDVKEVLKAQGKDKLKPVFHHAYLCNDEQKEGKKILTCTDSRILVCFKDKNGFFGDFENGLYKIVKNDKKEMILVKAEDEEYQYPNIFYVLPKEENIVSIGNLTGMKELKTGKFYQKFYSNFPECNIGINQKFLDLLLNDEEQIIYVNEDETKRSSYLAPVYFFEGDLIKIVMPFQAV